MRYSSKPKFGAVLVLLIALFVLINLTGFSKNIREFFYSFSAPLQEKMWAAGADVSNFFEGILRGAYLNEENSNLKNKNQELLAKIAELEGIKEENETLKEALNVGIEKDFNFDLAKVIGKDVGKDIIFINKGTDDGMSVGFPVIAGQKFLVGKISEVCKHFSKVSLVSEKDLSFDAKVANSQTYGIIKGEGNSKVSLNLIPRDSELREGDLIFTTSLGDTFPEGLLVGATEGVEKKDTEGFQGAGIKPAFELSKLDNVFIIVNF